MSERQCGRRITFALLFGIGLYAMSAQRANAQTPARGVASASARDGAPASSMVVEANLLQLMRGIFFPNSNVIFPARDQNPADVKPAKDPSTAVDPLENTYGKWEAVENSSLAIADAANMLMASGRKCANGLNVPIRNADGPSWFKDCETQG